MKLNKYLPALLMTLLLIGSGCRSSKDSKAKKDEVSTTEVVAESKKDLSQQGYTKGTVKDLNGKLDGCGWIIEVSDSLKYEPMGLDESFRKDGQVIWFKFKFNKSAMSICMVGKIINLTAVEVE